MKAAVRAMCNGCGRVIMAGAPAIFDYKVSTSGTWVALRHPECRNSPDLLNFGPLEALT